MLTGLFAVIAIAGVISLGTVRGHPWLRAIAMLATAALAMAATAAVVELCRWGERLDWSGDGWNVLAVYLGLLVAVPLALFGWSGVVRQVRSLRHATDDAVRAVPGREDAKLYASLAMIAVGVAGAAATAGHSYVESKPSHDAEIVQLAFCDAQEGLHSLDATGTWKSWDLASGTIRESWQASEIRDAETLALAPSCARALVATSDGVRLVELGRPLGGRVAERIDARDAVFVAEDRIAAARGDAVFVADLANVAAPLREQRFAAPVASIAAGGGLLAVATADGALAIGDASSELRVQVALPEPAVRLALAPGGGPLLAVSASQRGWIVSLEGEIAEPPPWSRFGRAAFVRRDLVVHAGADFPEVHSLALPALEPAPFLNHGSGVTALAATSAGERVAVAFGANLHLTGPVGPRAQAVVAARLVHPRL